MDKTNVADIIIKVLSDSGVKRIYGLIGDSLNPLGEAVRRSGQIDWITVRHEETAALAADAEALLSGELCVCAGTSGPGSIHLINGLYDANRNRAPVLAIVTDFISAQAGLDYFQATTPMRLYEDCSLFCERVLTVRQIPRLLNEAMEAALNNHGVAVLILPKDISESEIDYSPYERRINKLSSTLVPSREEVLKLAEIINQSRAITLYCGYGCRQAKAEVLEIANLIKSPVVHTLNSKYFMEADNPFDVGMNGLLSNWESKQALDNCDLLIMLGCDFPFNRFLPTNHKTVQIDLNPKHLGRRSRLDLGIAGDVKATLDLLKPMLNPKDNDEHLQRSRVYFKNNRLKKLEALKALAETDILNPEYFTKVLNDKAHDDAIFTVDVGLNDVWAARYLQAKPARVITGSFRHGTMAAAIPMALGAAYAFPKRQIIAMAGDGGLTMLLGDLLTIVQHHIDIKIIVYNNGELGFINKEDMMDKIPFFQTRLKNPNFAELARVIGMESVRIDHPQGMAEILEAALEYKGPLLIDALTNPDALGN